MLHILIRSLETTFRTGKGDKGMEPFRAPQVSVTVRYGDTAIYIKASVAVGLSFIFSLCTSWQRI
jgi:hypothetical protein